MIDHKPFNGARISIMERNIGETIFSVFSHQNTKQSMALPLRFPICRFWDKVCVGVVKSKKCALKFAKVKPWIYRDINLLYKNWSHKCCPSFIRSKFFPESKHGLFTRKKNKKVKLLCQSSISPPIHSAFANIQVFHPKDIGVLRFYNLPRWIICHIWHWQASDLV